MNLPPLSPEAALHEQQVAVALRDYVNQKGPWISFADFMQFALYAPGLGYYSAGSQKFGASGDFVTAPEISALFSQTLALQCVEILKQLPAKACILELGAGSGRMAGDIILMLAKQNCLPEKYYILEVSADLKERQQQHLRTYCPDYFENIIWLNSLPEKPFHGIILGNEVIDAMPVHLFQITQEKLLEGQVGLVDEQWQLAFRSPISETLTSAVAELQSTLSEPLSSPYTSEINLGLNAWVASLSACLHQGVMLFIDYGFTRQTYYHPSRHMGTLMCHYRHHAHDNPMIYIGLQDITAHVDFTALAFAAKHSGLDVMGFTQQATFLLANGLLQLVENNDYSVQQQLEVSQQIQKLTYPHEMGELFKVMALGKEFEGSLQGFALSDQRYRL